RGVLVDVLLVGKRDAGGLLVRALAESDTASELDRTLDIRPGSVQVALQNDADVLPIRRVKPLLEETQRDLGVRARLHVDAHECPMLARAIVKIRNERQAQLCSDSDS